MPLPDYQDGSLVNLMTSLALGLDGEAYGHAPLRLLPPEEVRGHRNVMLLVIDGLGHDLLLRHAQAATLNAHLRGRITSVFPSTTAAAVTTLLTGVSPAEHAMTGWHMYLRELGSVLAVLPGRPRYGGCGYGKAGIDPRRLYGHVPFSTRHRTRCTLVSPSRIAYSDYNQSLLGRAQLRCFESLDELFAQATRSLRDGNGRQYLHAYWPEFDHLSHAHGAESAQALAHLEEIDRALTAFLHAIDDTDTLLLVTADHGMTDAPDRIELEHHPELADMLVLPLCGEPRAAWCHLRAGREAAFERYVTDVFGDRVDLYRSESLIEQGWFGDAPPHAQLTSRIGDYALLPRDGRMIVDRLPHEDALDIVGCHGGLSAAEMYVPLIVAKIGG